MTDKKKMTINEKIIEASRLLHEVSNEWKEEQLLEYPHELPSFDELIYAISNIVFVDGKRVEGDYGYTYFHVDGVLCGAPSLTGGGVDAGGMLAVADFEAEPLTPEQIKKIEERLK